MSQRFSYPGVKCTITVSTIKILSFQENRFIQTEETKIRLLLGNRSDQGLHSCNSICTSLLLPVETTVLEKKLPAETVYVILLPAEFLQEANSRGQTLQEAIYPAVLVEAKYDGESWQNVKTGRLLFLTYEAELVLF